MKIKIHYVGLMLLCIGAISLTVLVFDYETTKIYTLSQKIDSLLVLVPDCDYPYEKSNQINEMLYNAQTKLLVDNDYDTAASLTNLAIGKLFSCQTDTQIQIPYLILFPILLLMIIFGVVLSIRKEAD